MAHKSMLVSSISEVRNAIENGFSGPSIFIPFGADECTPCMFFHSVGEIREEELKSLLELSYQGIGGIRFVHMIPAPPRFNTGPVFYRVST